MILLFFFCCNDCCVNYVTMTFEFYNKFKGIKSRCVQLLLESATDRTPRVSIHVNFEML